MRSETTASTAAYATKGERAAGNHSSPSSIAGHSPPPRSLQRAQQAEVITSTEGEGAGNRHELSRVHENLSLVLGSGLYEDQQAPLVQELLKTVNTLGETTGGVWQKAE